MDGVDSVDGVDTTLPDWLLAHARRFYAEGGTPVAPRRAATVVLLRDSPDGPLAYLVRRAASMAFASGMYAFPGGSVDPRDETDEPGTGPMGEWAHLLGLSEAGAGVARTVLCAAVRETFEEAGVLLAGPSTGTLVRDVDTDDWEADRKSLVAHRTGLSELLAARGLVLRGDLLAPWARWITPEFEPRRYDTFFFLAALPAGQVARQVGGEADRVMWIRPADAVAEHRAGRMAMLPPTVSVLSALRGFDTVSAALSAAGRPLVPVLPRVVLTSTGGRFELTGEG